MKSETYLEHELEKHEKKIRASRQNIFAAKKLNAFI
jgi:hypothetical protein